jgi:hypothetical protein
MGVGEPIIRSSVSAIGRYLTKASQATSSPLMTAVSSADLFRIVGGTGDQITIEANLECLAIVTGAFGDLGTQGLPANFGQGLDPDQMFVKTQGGQLDVSVLKTLGLIDLPNSYLEFRFERHPAAEAFRLTPKVAYFRTANSARNPQSAKNIEISVTIIKPTSTGAPDLKQAGEGSGLVAQIPFVAKQLVPGRLKKGGAIDFDTIWIATPKLPTDDQVAGVRGLVRGGGSITISPANLFVTYREVDEPDLLLSFLASIVSDNSPQISSVFEEVLRSAVSKGSK